MSSYAGLDEIGLRKLLDTSSDITERRKIRAALRELRTNNNNSVVNPHIRTPISPSKLSHHQSFRTERRRRPEIDDVTKKQSQDDDILYRSRRRREMDAGRGQGGGGGDEGDDENEVVVDIEMKIKEIGSDEQKLTKLLSETRDFNDRRKVRSAIREVKRKTRQQDDCDATTKPTNQSQAQPAAETAVTVLQENQTNLALSRSTEGQRSSSEGQDLTQETSRRDIDQEIEALQKQLEGAETYEERRKLRTEIRELRQKKTGLSLPRTSNNSPSYNNNSSNTNSNNSRGLATTQGFESSIKPDGAIILKNHGVREEEEESSGKPANVRRTNAETKETPLVVADDSRRAKKEEKGKPVTGETSDERPSSESSSSPQTSLASFKECSGKDEDRVASTSEERVSVSNGNQYGGDVSEEHEIVEASSVPVSPSNLPSSSSSSSSSPSSPSSSASPSSSSPPSSPPPPPQPSSINASPLSSQSFDLPEPRDDRDSVEKESVKPQESDSSDTEIDSEKVRCEIPNQDECGPESIVGPVLENVEMDADDEASKCDNIQTTKQAKPIPAVRKTKPETKPSQTSSSPSSSSVSSSSSSSGASSSGSSSELDEVTGQPKEKRKHIGLKEVMRRRAQVKATELAKQSTKEVKKVESEETCTQEEPPSVSKAVNNATKDETEKIDRTIDGDTKNSDDSLVSKTTENLAVESTLEVKDVGDVKASRKRDDGSATKEEQKEGDEETSSSQSPVSSLSLSYTESEKVEAPSEDKSVSNDADSISKVKDTTGTVSPKISMTLHSPVTSTTTFPISNSTSPSTSTSENISSVIEVTPKMSERVQSTSQSLSTSSGSQSQKVNSSASEDSHDGAVLSVDKTNSSEHTPIRSSPDTSTTPSIPKNFGHPFRFHKTRDDNAIPTPKKTTTSVKRSESAVSSLQAKRNKFLNNRPRPDDDTSPTSSTPARSFKNVVSGSKFAALREKFSASNGNSNNNAGQGKHGGHSPSSSTTPKSLWQQKSPSSSSRFGGSISEESSPNTSEQKKSIYGTPPSSPPTPLPYMTPPESPLDFKGKTSTPLASSTPTGAAELKSPAELKRQFLFGRDDSQQGDVFVDEKGAKDENSNLKDSMAPIEQIDDEAALEKMLEEATEFDERKKIRSRLREVRKKKRDKREQKAQEQERAFEEKMHKLEVESAQQRMRAVGLNVQKTPVDNRTKTVTETKDDGKTKTVVETTMRDSGSSKSVQMTIMSKTEDEGFKSETLQQESKSISVGPGGSSSVTMSKSVSSSSSSTTSTDKPKGKPKTKFEEEMEVKKREREEKRKQDEAKFKEQQMQRKKEAYELKKKQAEDAKNRKAALFNKFGGAGGGAKPAGGGGGGGGMRVQNATTIKQKLLEWAQRVTRGYSGVNVTNFSSSWADGLAFCAVIHHYYPDSFDFNILDPKQRRKNFDLAFNTAEEQADIMPLLDTDDMIMMKNNPDWKCVFTYVQSLYRHLNK